MAKLRDYLFESMRPFTLDGIAIGGEEYIALIEAYLDSMNSGTVRDRDCVDSCDY